MPSGVEEKDWVKQELQRLADSVFLQMDRDRKELTDAVTELTTRVNGLEIAQAGNASALVSQLRIDVDNLSGQVTTINTNLGNLTARFNLLVDYSI